MSIAATTPRPLLEATLFFVALLTAISTLGSFATSVYLPSMPAIGVALAASPSAVQLTLTAYLAAFAAGQLLLGPLSDRFGRRPVLIAGFVIYLAASLACALATSITMLVAARVAQAIGASAGMVVSRAVVRDAFAGPGMTKVLSAIAVGSAVIPAAAPLIGGGLQQLFDWHAAFVATLVVGLAVAGLTLTSLPETNRRRLDRLDGFGIVRAYSPVVRSGQFLVCAALNACAFGALYAFLAGAAHVMIEVIGVSPAEFGIYPPIAITGSVIGGVLSARLAGKVSERHVVATGLGLLFVGGVSMALFPVFGVLRPSTITLCMFAFSAGMSVLMPVSIAIAIRPFGERAGTAAALIGFLTMAAGALGSAIVAATQPFGVLAFPLTMAGMATLGVVIFLGLAHRVEFR